MALGTGRSLALSFSGNYVRHFLVFCVAFVVIH